LINMWAMERESSSFAVGICVLMDLLCSKNLEEGSGFSYL
jgi:hypothetical protein